MGYGVTSAYKIIKVSILHMHSYVAIALMADGYLIKYIECNIAAFGFGTVL